MLKNKVKQLMIIFMFFSQIILWRRKQH